MHVPDDAVNEVFTAVLAGMGGAQAISDAMDKADVDALVLPPGVFDGLVPGGPTGRVTHTPVSDAEMDGLVPLVPVVSVGRTVPGGPGSQEQLDDAAADGLVPAGPGQPVFAEPLPVSPVGALVGLTPREYRDQVNEIMAGGVSREEAIRQLDDRWATMAMVDGWGVSPELNALVAGLITGDLDAGDVGGALSAETVAALQGVELVWVDGKAFLRWDHDTNIELTVNGWTGHGQGTTFVATDMPVLGPGLDPLAEPLEFPWLFLVGVGLVKAPVETVVTAPQWVPALGMGIADTLAAGVPFTDWREDQADAFIDGVIAGMTEEAKAAMAGDPDAIGALVFGILASKGAASASGAGRAGVIARVTDNLAGRRGNRPNTTPDGNAPPKGDPIQEHLDGDGSGSPGSAPDYPSDADAAYDIIRGDKNDVELIASNTDFTPAQIADIKDHLFVKEHLLDKYRDLDVPAEWGRFDADPRYVDAWDRLQRGNPTHRDIQLLQHELAELDYMRRTGNPSYLDAHEHAQRIAPSPMEGG